MKNANYSYKKFYGALIFSGNCDYAYSFMLNLFYFLKKITGLNPFTILNNIFKTGMPVMYYKRYRRGRKFIKVPCPINKSKQLTLVMRWIIILLKQKVRGKSFSLFDMVNLLLEIYFSRGLSGVFFEYKKSFYTLLEDNMYLSKYLR